MSYVAGYPAWSYVYRKELEHSAMGVAVSNSLVPDLLSELGEKHAEKVCSIRNGVDIDRLDSQYDQFEQTHEELGTILFAGRLIWAKGVLDLVTMGELLRKKKMNAKILVHGRGPLLRKITRSVKELSLRNMEIKGFSELDMIRSEEKFIRCSPQQI